jgi:hypothetical protein
MASSAIVPAFERIRDIFYAIPLSPAEPDRCCSGKMKTLKAWCDVNGIPSRYRVCAFRWSDVGLPPDLLAVLHADDSTHVYLEVSLGGNWIDVDPTWDRGLAAVLPVNEWDGRNDTRIAVPPLSRFSHEESARIME